VRIREGYVARDVAGTTVVVPIGERVVEFNGLISLNRSARVLWDLLTEGCEEADLIRVLTATFEVDAERAAVDARAFVAELAGRGILDDDRAE
jgi:hypothetical protein